MALVENADGDTLTADAAEATRADVSGDETEDHAVVYMTTLTCGATFDLNLLIY